MAGGLQSAVDQLQSYGRGPDTMLAHISPDEAQFIDKIQGGRKTNPMTGLPEYSLLGDILKTVVRAGATIAGFAVGGPLGAAAGAGIATKLTGGSWNEALTGAAFAGVGGELGQGLSGGSWDPTGAASGAASGATAGSTADFVAPETAAGAAGGGIGAIPASAESYAIPAVTMAGAGGGGLGALTAGNLGAVAQSTPALAAAAGSVLGGQPQQTAPPPLQAPPQQNIPLNNLSLDRYALPQTGVDWAHAAEGPSRLYYNNVNAQAKVLPPDSTAMAPTLQEQQLENGFYARGGRVRGYADGGAVNPQLAQAALQGYQMAGKMGYANGGRVRHYALGGGVDPQIAQAAMRGYQMAAGGGPIGLPHLSSSFGAPSPAAMMGAVHGPGTGKSDSVPAMLSQNEHVIDAPTVSAAGGGSSDAGHQVIDHIKSAIRTQAGFKNPGSPPPAGISTMVTRAKRRAGVTKTGITRI